MPEKVKAHTHVIPRVYLRRFAVDGELIACRPGGQPELLGVPVVGVRKRFYTLRLADGRGTNQVENSLGMLEGAVQSAFTAIDRGELPLGSETKAVMAEFIGTQMARGVAYREMRNAHAQQNESWLRERVRELFIEHAPAERHTDADDYAGQYDLSRLSERNVQIRAAIGTGQILANTLVNMRWTTIRFAGPMLLSSDQPIVCWLGPHRASPWGPWAATEIRVPLSPSLALVATWDDGPDPAKPIDGDLLNALSVNHYTRRQAVDWVYWMPGNRPRHGQPLHDEAIVGSPVQASRRRELTGELVARLLESREPSITVFSPAEPTDA